MKKILFIFVYIFLYINVSSYELIELIDDYKYINIQNNFLSPYYALVEEIGDKGSKDGQLYFPGGIAFDGFNRIYVVDTENSRIAVFEDGKFLFNIRNNFRSPVDIHNIPGTERYIVTDKSDHSIKVIFRDGKPLSQYGGILGYKGFNFAWPSGVFVDDSYNIYITDRVNDNIKVIDRFMNIVSVFDVKGTEKGQLNQPLDIYVSGENLIYVVNYGNDRIDVYDKKFRFKFFIGERGSQLTQFRGPSGITGDYTDNIYVCDTHNSRVQKFDKDGLFIASIGEGILKQPVFADVDNSGTVYVTDAFYNKIFIFSPAVFELGKKSIFAGEYEKASKYFEIALKIDNKNLNAYYYLGYCYFKLGDFSKVSKIKEDLEKISDNCRALELLTVLENKYEKWGDGR